MPFIYIPGMEWLFGKARTRAKHKRATKVRRMSGAQRHAYIIKRYPPRVAAQKLRKERKRSR